MSIMCRVYKETHSRWLFILRTYIRYYIQNNQLFRIFNILPPATHLLRNYYYCHHHH